MRKLIALTVLATFCLAAQMALAAGGNAVPFSPVQYGPVSNPPQVQKWAPDHLMVQFTTAGLQRASLPTPGDKSAAPVSRTGISSLDAALAAVGVTGLRAAYPGTKNKALAKRLGTNRWYFFDLTPGVDIPAAAARLSRDPNIAEAQPDLHAFPAVAPNDPLDPTNWGHNNTAQMPAYDWGGTWAHNGPGVGTPGFDSNAHAAWGGAQGYGTSSVIIAILDMGVDVGHPDLTQVTGYDFGDNDPNPMDDSAQAGHGTACAGIAAAIANNSTGVAGIAGGCSIMPLKVANSAGNMNFSSIDQAIYYAADNGADVISMSLGAAANSIPSTDAAINYAYGLGVSLLAATGNENAGVISYPAINGKVIGVGAASPCGGRKRSGTAAEVNAGINPDPNGATCDGERWWGSNYGNSAQDNRGAVDIIAPTMLPTTDIQGAAGYDPGNYSSFFNGTSCATPYAAGVCALIKSANPSFTPNQVRAQLVGSAQDVINVESVAGWDRYTGYGMVDAAAAVGAVIPPATSAFFSAVDSVGCAPFTVNFIDQSTGNVANWVWDFGDGNLGVGQNPNHTYTTAGTYDVSLSISGPDGNASLTKMAFVVASDVPTVTFTPNTTTVITGGTSVAFTDNSTGSPTAWAWDFGDGGTDTLQSPHHVFNAAGAFNVTLTATNACGPGTLTMNYLIIVTPPAAPIAGFTFTPSGGCAPQAVAFTDASTGAIASWAWDFGDGGTDNVQNPSHTYTTAGTYDVSLIVTNSGGTDTMTVASALLIDSTPATAWTASDTLIAEGASVSFTDNSTGTPTAWDWNFGDGGTDNVQNPSHLYLVAGIYDVTLITTNGCGQDTLTAPGQVTVEALAAPIAAFGQSAHAGCAPLQVSFSDSSLNNVQTWHWDFGDGAQDTLQNPMHSYLTAGSYNVQLIVTGTGGADSLAVNGAVVVTAPAVAAFTVSDTLGFAPLGVTFTDASSGNPTSWSWDFGDATTDTVASPLHSYTALGTYDVTLVVSNGCSADTLTMTAAVTINGLSAVGDNTPVRFGLQQNYPNPFNPSTTIVYSLAKPGPARLDVFDMSGRKIATLVDGTKTAGQHEITWRPVELPSGIYFSRLTAGGQSDTRRVTLLK